ncbi:MAG: tetratricopeptide repeat protein [Acidiferrobacterales bacterium]
MHQDERGYVLTTESAEAASALDMAIHNFLHWKAAILPKLKEALKADPSFGFGHAANGLILHGARNIHFRPKIEASLAAAKAAEPMLTERERLYVRALEAAARGQIAESVATYETILARYPTDLFAQRLAQMELFWIGEMRWSAEISGRVATHWHKNVPSYGIYLSCRAFDLEETHRFEEAERLGREAVKIDPSDVWGTHAVAHVLIMQGRHDEGVAWLDGLKENWADANQMMLHLWWHRCLFHLERGEFDAVLDIYDAWIRNRELPLLRAMPDLYIDMQNGASMLLRLELRRIDVGSRWDELAELTLGRLDDHTSPLTSAHFAVILAATARFEQADQLVRSMHAFATNDTGTLGPRYRIAVIPAAEAAIAHRKGEHQRVVDILMPTRQMLWEMGGSHAQRDLFFLVLADSALKLGRQDLVGIILNDIELAGFTDAIDRVGYKDASASVH